MNDILNIDNFEQIKGEEMVRKIIRPLGKLAMDFAGIERRPRYANGERENDAEHSFMLSLVATELAAECEPALDIGLVAQFATVHDLIELKTGDTPTMHQTVEQRTAKTKQEHAALPKLLQELPPHTAKILQTYERQDTPEARFVRYVDKLLPFVAAIHGQGIRVMKEDYSLTTLQQLREKHQELQQRFEDMFNGEFPALDQAHRVLTEMFEAVFIEAA